MSSTTPLRTDVRSIEGDDVRALDRHFGDALVRWARPAADAPSAALLRRLGTLLSAELGRQNVCLELATLAETAGGDWPSPGRILELLEGHGLLRSGDDPAPLVVEAGRLYLARYHDYEVQVARALHLRAGRTVDAGRDDPAATAARLAGLFPDEPGADVNWQRVGAAIALDRALAVITGGPGTGKTTTVTRLLVMLLEQAGDAPLRIRLAAPTGKAAARLTESIRDSRTRLLDAGLCTPEIADALPDAAETLHRLLGYRALENGFRYGPDRSLAADVVVVDEASMVDLRMMAQLLSALDDDTRLILLGDKDQLSSVEAGRVLGDLCAWTEAHFEQQRFSPAAVALLRELAGYDFTALADPGVPVLADALCLLRRSHRFDAGSAIGRFATAVNEGAGETAQKALEAGDDDLCWEPEPTPEGAVAMALAGHRAALERAVQPGVEPAAALDALAAFRMLCATRGGPLGVVRMNAAIETGFRREGLIPPGEVLYPGRPLMITVNDYGLGLFNGDVGLVLADADGTLRVWFLGPDRELRPVRPTRLPRHETVFAMTVHKSQGSEFDRVEVVLPTAPGESASRLLTREMLYTAVTRARTGVGLHASREVVRGAIGRRTARSSGLRDRLWPSGGRP